MPPFWQGLLAQPSAKISHSSPVHSAGQEQLKLSVHSVLSLNVSQPDGAPKTLRFSSLMIDDGPASSSAPGRAPVRLPRT